MSETDANGEHVHVIIATDQAAREDIITPLLNRFEVAKDNGNSVLMRRRRTSMDQQQVARETRRGYTSIFIEWLLGLTSAPGQATRVVIDDRKLSEVWRERPLPPVSDDIQLIEVRVGLA